MNPHQKPQEDVVEAMAEAMYEAHLKRNKPWLVESLFLKDRWRASARAALALVPAYEAGRRDMREAAGKYRHVKRGTIYEVIGRAELQMNCDLLVDGSEMVVYRGDDGKLWVREESEFHDGRFEALPTEPLGGEG